MNTTFNPLPLLGRILLALIFVLAGYNKLTGGVGSTVANMTSHGIPAASALVYGAIAVELAGGLMLMIGLYARWSALVLFVYMLTLAVIFHAYWAAPAAAMQAQHAFFYEHLSMMGGLLLVVAYGAGPLSVDQAFEHGVRHAGYPAGGHPAE
ncbi:MAG: DoxX family protein [Alphaproteobacteria bacterium]|nr:DoxX family protein [Alphaproteobacteria bacterium]